MLKRFFAAARARAAPDFDKLADLPAAALTGAAPGGRAPTKQWAAFALSGVGR
jgi:hypothetical protein